MAEYGSLLQMKSITIFTIILMRCVWVAWVIIYVQPAVYFGSYCFVYKNILIQSSDPLIYEEFRLEFLEGEIIMRHVHVSSCRWYLINFSIYRQLKIFLLEVFYIPYYYICSVTPSKHTWLNTYSINFCVRF